MSQSQLSGKKLNYQQFFQFFSNSFTQSSIAFIVLFLGLILTGFAWSYTSKTVEQETEEQFKSDIDEGLIALNNRIQVYLNTFYAARGFWQAENLDVKVDKWQRFVNSLDLEERYPGINGLGFIRSVPNNKDIYEQWVRESHGSINPIYKNYVVHPPGDRVDYFVIEYCEPIARNQQAIGLDVGHEPIRRQGAEKARDTGKPAATGRITLVQDLQRTPGLLIYLPIYRLGMPVNTVEERRKAFFGFIYAPFRVLDLIEEGLPSSVQENFDVVVYNGADLLYGSEENLPTRSGQSSRYSQKQILNVAGQPWEIYFVSRPQVGLSVTSEQNLPGIVLVIGICSSFLLFGIVWALTISYQKTKEAKEASDAAKEAADTANRAKSEFLANMSHELRTPLNAIIGFTQILQRDSSLKEKQQKNIEIINRSGEHLLSLINDVLDMSKIEAGRIVLSPHKFNVYSLLNTLKEMFQSRAEMKGLHLLFERGTNVPQYVQADENKLRQVLVNLIGNALKFTEEGGVIIRVNSEAERLIFEVEDTGPGIAADELHTVFTAFVQTNTGRKSQEGTGLGLPISQKFVQLMGGTISVESEEGRGSIFKFDIQIKIVQAEDTSAAKPTQRVIGLVPDQKVYRILVVDDRWENRQVLIELLSSVGFEVREATNGQEAIDVWKTWEPHLIWMDMRMPVMSGYEATQKIKATPQGKTTTIIALTASAFEEERNQVIVAGCDDFLHKPFRETLIFEKMAEHIGVKYLYEQKDKTEKPIQLSRTQEVDLEKLQAVYLPKMDAQWVDDLRQAAIELNFQKTLALIEEIPGEFAPLAIALKNWVQRFQFENIAEFTQKN